MSFLILVKFELFHYNSYQIISGTTISNFQNKKEQEFFELFHSFSSAEGKITQNAAVP